MADNYHLLHIRSVDEEGRVEWRVLCPFEPDDHTRDCLFGTEPDEPCLWWHYENEGHHAERCPGWEVCEASVSLDDGRYFCWEGLPEPEECDGFTSIEGDHCHPENGCGVMEAAGWEGFGETVHFEGIDEPDYPIPVRVRWEDGYCVLVGTTRQGESR